MIERYDHVLDGPIYDHVEAHEVPQKYRIEYLDGPGRRWQNLNIGEGPFNLMMYHVQDYRDKYPPEKAKYRFKLVPV